MAHLEGLMKDLNAITTAWWPSPGHDSSLSLEVWNLTLKTRNCTEYERTALESRSQQTSQCLHMGLALGTATCLLLVSLDDAFVEATSLCLLIVCRTGHHGPKFCVQGRGKKCNLPFTLWSVAVSSCCNCITFMECRHWHLYVQFCVLFYFILKKTLSKAKEVCDVLRKQLMLDCWFQLLMESHWQCSCLTPSTGVGLFGVLFLFF